MKKKYLIIGIVLLILIGLGLFFLLNRGDEEEIIEKTDAGRFAEEYTMVNEDNVFMYRTIDEIIKIMKNGTGVVYLGFPECPWCQSYVTYLNDVAKEVGIKEIYYYNILEDRKNNTEEYQEIVKLLGDALEYDEEGNHRIYVPNVSFHVNGKLIGNDLETAYDTKGFDKPEDYWTDKEVSELKETLKNYMGSVKSALNTCTDCNK